jgi:glycosyltransferase involved in cell wall biosynthesis
MHAPQPILRVVEPRLLGPSGHYGEFVRALALRSGGIFGAIEVVSPAASAAFVPTLSSTLPTPLAVSHVPLPAGPLAELRAIRAGLRSGRHVLVLTANPSHALFAGRLGFLRSEELARLSFFVHWPLSKPAQQLALALSGRARAESRFLAPTKGVLEPLEAAHCARAALVGYPAIRTQGAPARGPFRHLLMAGAARINKGLDLVAGLAERFAKEGRETPLLVQVSPKHVTRHGSREDEVVSRLLAAGYRGLVADPKAPDRDEYAARFAGAIVLAPYDREKFVSGVSGIVLDALLHGAPCIATGGTWAGDVVKRFGAGEVLAERTEAALARAVDRVIARWDHYRDAAARASETLAAEHDPRGVARLVAGPREP